MMTVTLSPIVLYFILGLVFSAVFYLAAKPSRFDIPTFLLVAAFWPIGVLLLVASKLGL